MYIHTYIYIHIYTCIYNIYFYCQATSVFRMFSMMWRKNNKFLSVLIYYRLGRRKSIILYLFWAGAFGVATAFSTNMTMYIILRCLTQPAAPALFDSCSVLSKMLIDGILMGSLHCRGYCDRFNVMLFFLEADTWANFEFGQYFLIRFSWVSIPKFSLSSIVGI